MYDPTVGRFITLDPIGFNGKDANTYRYCGNSPTNATDPTGYAKTNAKEFILKITGLSKLNALLDEYPLESGYFSQLVQKWVDYLMTPKAEEPTTDDLISKYGVDKANATNQDAKKTALKVLGKLLTPLGKQALDDLTKKGEIGNEFPGKSNTSWDIKLRDHRDALNDWLSSHIPLIGKPLMGGVQAIENIGDAVWDGGKEFFEILGKYADITITGFSYSTSKTTGAIECWLKFEIKY